MEYKFLLIRITLHLHVTAGRCPQKSLTNFLIMDFKANKYGKNCHPVDEIIEFAVLKMKVQTMEVEATFHRFVQPVITPVILTKLTGITQDKVAGQLFLPKVLEEFGTWMKEEGLLKEGVKLCSVMCGDWDLQAALPINCDYLQLSYGDYLKRWINIEYFTAVTRRVGGMGMMLKHLRLQQEGRHTSGLYYRNTARRDERLRNGEVESKLLRLWTP